MNMSFSWTERIIWITIWNIHTLILLYSTCAHWIAFTFYKYAPFMENNFAIKICPFPCEFAHLAFNLFSRKSVKSTDCIVQNMSFKTVHNTKKDTKLLQGISIECELQRISRNENLNAKHTQWNHLSALVFSIH